jgi:predicted nuclease of predicted toxin-antitoxin system
LKLLFDQNLSWRLAAILAEEFPESVHVREVDLTSAADHLIWEYARLHGFAIISKDSDFSQKSFLLGAPPKVIWIRAGNCSTQQLEIMLKAHVEDIRQFGKDQESSFLIIDGLLAPFPERREGSTIANITYDPGTKTLEIEFRGSGEIYRYFDVPADIYEKLLKAPSRNVYLHSQIMKNFRFQKVL